MSFENDSICDRFAYCRHRGLLGGVAGVLLPVQFIAR